MITAITDEEAHTLSEDEIVARFAEIGLGRDYALFVASVKRGEHPDFHGD